MAENVRLNKETSELLVTVSAGTKEWKEEQQKAFKSLASNLTIKGFRKGQAPLEVARKSIRQEDVFTTAVRKALDSLVQQASAQIDKDTLVLDSPTYRVDKISDAELEVTFIYPVYPEIELGKYKGLDVDYTLKPVVESDIENELQKLLSSRATSIDKDGLLAKGDIAKFDFEGFVDGQAFDGGKAKDYELELGSNQFISGFEDQMVGMKPGEERHVAVQFPPNYQEASLSGKDAIFIVQLKGIKAKVAPVLDDGFVKSLKINDVNNVDALKSYLHKIFEQQAEQDARQAFQRDVFIKLRAELKAVVPNSLIEREAHRQEDQFKNDLKKQGLDIAKYEKMTGQSHEKLHAQFHQSANIRLRDSLIFAEISKVEKLEPTEADYEAAYLKYASLNGQSVDAVKNVITKAQLQIPLTNDKVIDFLLANRETKKAPTKAAADNSATKEIKPGAAKDSTRVVKAAEATKTVKVKESTRTVKAAVDKEEK